MLVALIYVDVFNCKNYALRMSLSTAITVAEMHLISNLDFEVLVSEKSCVFLL